MIAVNGCGPTAVAMVVSGLLCDPSVTPYKVAKFAEEQGYYAGESGTSWTLMSEGVQSFGIWGEELGLSRSEVFSALESGCPIICSMRPGDFTTTGHFIVLTKVENGKIKVNDPNSRIRSGSARSASCHSFSVIMAIPKNKDRQIPPMSLISPI